MARTTAERPAPDETEPASAETPAGDAASAEEASGSRMDSQAQEPEEEPGEDAAEDGVGKPGDEPGADAGDPEAEEDNPGAETRESGAEEDQSGEDTREPGAQKDEPGTDTREAGAEKDERGAGAGEPEAEEAPEKEPRRRRRRLPRDPLLLVAVALTVAAAACAGYFGRSWYAAAHDDSLAYSRDRDAVLRAAEQGVQNMNTLDYRKVDQGLTSWEDSSTGDLRQELVQGRAQFASQVRQARTVTTARILDGAVTELDDRAGKAGVIVAVQITVTPPSGTPTTKQSRMRAQLTRTPAGWKLSALGQAPLGSTADGG